MFWPVRVTLPDLIPARSRRYSEVSPDFGTDADMPRPAKARKARQHVVQTFSFILASTVLTILKT